MKITFESQSTHILPVQGKNAFIFMADRWNPENAIDGRYVWLPVQFAPDGMPFLECKDKRDQGVFQSKSFIKDRTSAHESHPNDHCFLRCSRFVAARWRQGLAHTRDCRQHPRRAWEVSGGRSTDGKDLLAACRSPKAWVSKVELPGHKRKLNFKQTAEGLEVELPAHQPCKFAHGLKITGDIQ